MVYTLNTIHENKRKMKITSLIVVYCAWETNELIITSLIWQVQFKQAPKYKLGISN